MKSVLSFAQADAGVIISPDIDIYRELKLRLLNGTHTLSCGLAFLAGCGTVKEAMDDETISGYITELMQNELVPSIPYPVNLQVAQEFGAKVLDRFRNPHIKHQWISITVQYSSKMKMRAIPMLLKHYEKIQAPPELFAFGFAAYLQFLKPVLLKDGKYYGKINGKEYFIQDDKAETFNKRWQTLSMEELVKEVLQDAVYWGADLSLLPGFYESVLQKLVGIDTNGVRSELKF